jgi:hypothetical protein
MGLLTLTTDFGLEDYYVAAVKAVVLRHAPDTRILDITHLIPPGDIAAGAFVWAAAMPWFPNGGVHLAVVDPGVGSRRRILVAVTETGWLVAPDNGLLTHLLDATLPVLPAASRVLSVRSVEREDLFLPGPGQTFHGRDRFAPVAAWLLRGGAAEELGPEIEDPLRLAIEPARREPGVLSGSIIHIDIYGNVVTNIPSSWVGGSERPDVNVEVDGRTIRRLVTHYEEISPGEAAILPGSAGTLELSLRGESLSRQWNIRRGSGVRVQISEMPA